jgi:hypothetical protein
LIYILAARLPNRFAVELRKSPPDDLWTAISVVKRFHEAGSVGRPTFPIVSSRSSEGNNNSRPREQRDGDKSSGGSGGSAGFRQQLNIIRIADEVPLRGPVIAALNGENTRTTLDFGVEENLVPWKWVRENHVKYSLGAPEEVVLPGGRTAESRATCSLEITHKGSTATLPFRVVEGLEFPVLGHAWKAASTEGD